MIGAKNAVGSVMVWMAPLVLTVNVPFESGFALWAVENAPTYHVLTGITTITITWACPTSTPLPRCGDRRRSVLCHTRVDPHDTGEVAAGSPSAVCRGDGPSAIGIPCCRSNSTALSAFPGPPQADIRSADGWMLRNKLKAIAKLVDTDQGTPQSDLANQALSSGA